MLIRMKNIQTHVDTTFELREDAINILKGPNNSGKSVLSKTLRKITGVDENFKRSRDALIRTNCSFGEITIEKDERQLNVRIYPTYLVVTFEGEQYKEDTIPEHVMKEFGMFSSPGLLLNVLGDDKPLPLSQTTDITNHQIITKLLEHAGIEKMLETVELRINDINNFKSRVIERESYYSRLVGNSNLLDVESDEIRNDARKELLKQTKSLNLFYKLVRDREYIEYSEENFSNSISMLDNIGNLFNSFSNRYIKEDIVETKDVLLITFEEILKLRHIEEENLESIYDFPSMDKVKDLFELDTYIKPMRYNLSYVPIIFSNFLKNTKEYHENNKILEELWGDIEKCPYCNSRVEKGEAVEHREHTG